MDVSVTGAVPFSVDPTKAASVGDANFLEIQRTFGATYDELDDMRDDANKIESDGVDVRT